MKTKITNEILAKYFSGNCSDLEKQEVEHWKEISEDNSRVFEEMKAMWCNAFITNTYNPDPEASLHKVKSKLGFFNIEKAPDSKVIDFHVLRFILRVAAVLLIICAGYWFFHQYTENTKHQVLCSVSATDEKKIVILPDSSVSEDNPVLRNLWARNKIKYLDDYTKFYSGDDNYWQQSNKEIIGIKKEVTAPGQKYNLLTQDTSFIAVDSIIRNKSDEIVKVEQPLSLPEGVSNLAVAENDMKTLLSTSVEDLLQGHMGKVDISSVSGDPAAGLNIRIRGTSSLNAKNNPLIVVNGIPYDTNLENFDFATADDQKFANLIDVSPEEIESIEFLKDSATISKYGARATYGVINIKIKGYKKSLMDMTVAEMFQGPLGNVDISSVYGNSGADLNMNMPFVRVKNNPLIVVNGIPYVANLENSPYAADLENFDLQNIQNLTYVFLEDIETIDFLKDTATISKYGTAAANGVLNIKTKGDIKSARPVTVEELLQGRLRNVDISSVSGDPSAGLNIHRGTSSLNARNTPLIVVNGIPYAADLENFDFATADVQGFANLIDVSPEEIVSIEVLKDAATISKYGAAAANGVLSIKTKGRKVGKLKINTNSSFMKDTSAAATNGVIKGNAPKGKTFKIEDLKRPDKVLKLSSNHDIFQNLILSDSKITKYDIKKAKIDFPYNIVASSSMPDSLVSFGYNSFFNGMYQAYADHRPFVISPDMIWLLISQGFARHVNANAEMLRKEFVDFDGKLSLIVRNDSLKLDSPASSWEKIFPEFTKQIAKHTGDDLINVLTSDFSTTTPVEKIASEITIMEAMKPYFEFITMRIACGIPEITLKGTTKDWQEIYDKTKKLEKYDLKWWTDELEPILNDLIQTSKGKIDKNFWKNMFKYNSEKKCSTPIIIDGWIVKFFPYDKKGNRNNLKQLNGGGNLPDEIVKVDLKYIESFRDSTLTTPLELWAGFIGLEQNSKDFTLTPKIGWMIRKKDTVNFGLKYQLEKQANGSGISISVQQKPNEIVGHKEIKNLNIPYTDSILIPDKSKNVRIEDVGGWYGLTIRVQEIPNEIFGLQEIRNLNISFTDNILVPDKLKNIKIGKLSLSGKIDKSEIERISKMFPETELIINREKINAR